MTPSGSTTCFTALSIPEHELGSESMFKKGCVCGQPSKKNMLPWPQSSRRVTVVPAARLLIAATTLAAGLRPLGAAADCGAFFVWGGSTCRKGLQYCKEVPFLPHRCVTCKTCGTGQYRYGGCKGKFDTMCAVCPKCSRDTKPVGKCGTGEPRTTAIGCTRVLCCRAARAPLLCCIA